MSGKRKVRQRDIRKARLSARATREAHRSANGLRQQCTCSCHTLHRGQSPHPSQPCYCKKWVNR